MITFLRFSQICSELNVDGIRGDIVTNRAAKALAAFEGRTEVSIPPPLPTPPYPPQPQLHSPCVQPLLLLIRLTSGTSGVWIS